MAWKPVLVRVCSSLGDPTLALVRAVAERLRPQDAEAAQLSALCSFEHPTWADGSPLRTHAGRAGRNGASPEAVAWSTALCSRKFPEDMTPSDGAALVLRMMEIHWGSTAVGTALRLCLRAAPCPPVEADVGAAVVEDIFRSVRAAGGVGGDAECASRLEAMERAGRFPWVFGASIPGGMASALARWLAREGFVHTALFVAKGSGSLDDVREVGWELSAQLVCAAAVDGRAARRDDELAADRIASIAAAMGRRGSAMREATTVHALHTGRPHLAERVCSFGELASPSRVACAAVMSGELAAVEWARAAGLGVESIDSELDFRNALHAMVVSRSPEFCRSAGELLQACDPAVFQQRGEWWEDLDTRMMAIAACMRKGGEVLAQVLCESFGFTVSEFAKTERLMLQAVAVLGATAIVDWALQSGEVSKTKKVELVRAALWRTSGASCGDLRRWALRRGPEWMSTSIMRRVVRGAIDNAARSGAGSAVHDFASLRPAEAARVLGRDEACVARASRFGAQVACVAFAARRSEEGGLPGDRVVAHVFQRAGPAPRRVKLAAAAEEFLLCRHADRPEGTKGTERARAWQDRADGVVKLARRFGAQASAELALKKSAARARREKLLAFLGCQTA